jgi:carboxypeptidase family protein/TonB-dependent receptor-like protein
MFQRLFRSTSLPAERAGTCSRTMAGALVIVLGALSAPAAAQSGSGVAAIEGTVTDPDNAAIGGALVIIVSTETGYDRSTYTDGRGRYFVSAMPVSTYLIAVSAKGFAHGRRDGVRLAVGATETVNFSLKTAGVTETVTVSAAQPLLDKDETATASVVGSRAVSDLPIRGRDFTEFVQLTPGITQESDRNGLVIAGQRSINSNIAIDGTDFNDALQGNQRGGNEGVFFFPQTAIREFQVVRSGASSEVGRTNSGFINVVTKSGSNAVHGEAFLHDREKALTSPDAFGRKLNNQQSQFGGSTGGPLKHDRAFLFGAAEQSLLTVPYAVQFDAQAPGVTVPTDLLALQGEQRGTNHPTAVFGRTDVVAGSTGLMNVQGTYTRMHGDNFNYDTLQLNQAVTTNFKRDSESAGVKSGLTTVFGPGILNEIRGQIATDNRDEIPNVRSASIVINGFGNLGGDSGRPRAYDTTRYEVTDQMSATWGVNRLRFGVDYNLNDVRQQREDNIQGRYDFKSLSDYLARKVSRYRQTVLVFDPNDALFTGTQKEIAGYVQDKMSLGDTVTLMAGLRWEGQWNPQPTRPNPAIPYTAFIPNDLNQWQPRGGLAWDVTGGGTTIVRVSGGMYIARTPATLFQRVFTDNGITTIAVDSKFDPAVLNALSFPEPLSAVPAGITVAAPRVFGFDPDFKNPRSWQGSATVEQLMGDNVTLSIGYLFNDTHNLQRRLDRNLFAPAIAATGMPIFPTTRPDPTIGALSVNESTAQSRYDGLAVSLVRRFATHYQLQANYTLARTLDDDSNEHLFRRETALNPFDLASEWTYSKNDVRHNVNFNAVADMPGGFTAGAILFARTGTPYTPIIGFDTQNDANDENDRAIVNGHVVGRNSYRQPSFFDLDLRLLKGFRFGNDREIALMAEVFNVTRAMNLNFGPDAVSPFGTAAQPVATAGQPLFAPSTARFGGPRQMQLGMRVVF